MRRIADTQVWFWLAVLIGLCWVLMLPHGAGGQPLESTIEVKVRDRGGISGGSGVLIGYYPSTQGLYGIVLTASHVVESRPTPQISIRFSREQQWRAAGVVHAEQHPDVAVALVPMRSKRIQPSPLGQPPNPGDQIYAEGYPQGIYASGYAKVLPSTSYTMTKRGTRIPQLVFDAQTVQGISGGPIRNMRREVVSLVSATDPQMRESVAPGTKWVWGVVDRSGVSSRPRQTQMRRGFGPCMPCPPYASGGCPPGRGIIAPGQSVPPPPVQQQPQPQWQPAPQITQPAAPPVQQIELPRQKIELILRGLDGKDGAPGRDGANGRDGVSPSVEQIVRQVIAAMPPAQQGPPGPPGRDGVGQRGPAGPAGRDGVSPTINYDQIVQGVLSQIPQQQPVPTMDEILQAIAARVPVRNIVLVNEGTGEEKVLAQLDLTASGDIRIPWTPGTETTLGGRQAGISRAEAADMIAASAATTSEEISKQLATVRLRKN